MGRVELPVMPADEAIRQTKKGFPSACQVPLKPAKSGKIDMIEVRKRNPVWSRDELIVALDFYLSHRSQIPNKTSREINALSDRIGRVAHAWGLFGGEDFRNSNGVYMKLMNFKSLDQSYRAQGRSGLTSVGNADREVWNEFSNDSTRCRTEALRIIQEAQGAPRYWALVADPRRYRILDAVANRTTDTWTSKGKPIRRGDHAIIWQSRDNQGRRGIVALATIVEGPALRLDADNPYWVNHEDGNRIEERVGVRYIRITQLLWMGASHDEVPSTSFGF
jgi:hypothetical protein